MKNCPFCKNPVSIHELDAFIFGVTVKAEEYHCDPCNHVGMTSRQESEFDARIIMALNDRYAVLIAAAKAVRKNCVGVSARDEALQALKELDSIIAKDEALNETP